MSELVLGLVRIVKEGVPTDEYDRWVSFFKKQEEMKTRHGSAKLVETLKAMGIKKDYA